MNKLDKQIGEILVIIDESAHFEASNEEYDEYYSEASDFTDQIECIRQAFIAAGWKEPKETT